MRITVTGALGRIARRVIPGLARDFDLVLTDRSAGKLDQTDVHELDVTNVENLTTAFAGSDVILHFAIASPDSFFGQWQEPRREDRNTLQKYYETCLEVNAKGSWYVYEAAVRASVPRVVYISSLAVLVGEPWMGTANEHSAPRCSNFYAATKLFGEEVGREYVNRDGLTVYCLRLGQPFPYGNPKEEGFLTRPRARGSLVSFSDIELALRAALTNPSKGFFVFPVVSESDQRWIDLTAAENMGYRPSMRLEEDNQFHPINRNGSKL